MIPASDKRHFPTILRAMPGILDSPNPAVLAFLRKALAEAELRASEETSTYEFDDCQYHLMRDRAAPDVVRLSFKAQSPLSSGAEAGVAAVYTDSAAEVTEAETGYQVTLQVLCALHRLHACCCSICCCKP